MGLGILIVEALICIGVWVGVGVYTRSHRRQHIDLGPEDAVRFFQARGMITLQEWARLDGPSREALAAVGRRVDDERLLTQVVASGSPEGLSEVMAPYDGGASRDQIVMKQAFAVARQNMGS